MVKNILTLSLFLLVALALPPQVPVIGILTQDAEDLTESGKPVPPFQTYIASSYVKNIEMAGAQAVPLFYHLNKTSLLTILSKLNGVFMPGGEMPIDTGNQWTQNTATIL